MKTSYETGLDTNDIYISVNAGTPGVATSVIYLARTGGPRTKIAESNLQSGHVPNTLAGKSAEVRGSYFLVQTVVDLGILDPVNWPAAVANLAFTCELSGGLAGTVQVKHDPDDVKVSGNGKIVTIAKQVNLI
jgi:hypothetical protein